jgi:hypothetical protein
MQKFKERSSKDLALLLTAEERKAFDMQRGLNRSTFWKNGFRSIPAQNHKIFIQKRNYIHMNPVRAGIVELPWEYRWSSSSLLVGGHMDSGARLATCAGSRSLLASGPDYSDLWSFRNAGS